MKAFNSGTKKAAAILVGPLGCYIAYQTIFVFRYLDIDKYPNLTSTYYSGALIIDIICAAFVAILGIFVYMRIGKVDDFYSSKNGFSTALLSIISAGTLFLLSLSAYRVFGTLSIGYAVENYHTYSYMVTSGGAWIVLGMYCAVFLQLMDMYFSGVTKKNSAFLLINILIIAFSGGRGILILFVLMFLVMLMFQRVSLKKFIAASLISASCIGLSYLLITEMRSPAAPSSANESGTNKELQSNPIENKDGLPESRKIGKTRETTKKNEETKLENLDPTSSFEDLNYNAAFISEDVLRSLKNGQITPRAFALEDTSVLLIPRKFMPNKPISTAETIELYPQVAKRGTNITFPLKANILMHLGLSAFYFDWFVVALCQTLMLAGIYRRIHAPGVLGFSMLFSGIGFAIIARGGIFNARLLVICLCIALSYLGYRILLKTQILVSKLINERKQHMY